MPVPKADGVCFYDSKWGFWTGSFVDATHEEAVNKCISLAKELADGRLPPDGDVVVVSFVVDEVATQRILGARVTENIKRLGDTLSEDV
jgi:hypothetical protein